jgi:hypothetical protein
MRRFTRIQSLATPLKKSGKVIGNFNFTPVRKTFDEELNY